MRLFDLHCDTLTELRCKREAWEKNTCQIALDRARSVFDDYTQVMAIWSEDLLDGEENYRRFDETLDYALPMLQGSGFSPIFAVEGGKLLGTELSRLDHLAKRGVKILTLVWKDSCSIGGAYNTDEGLTAFGRAVIERCFDLEIVPDLSHASDRMFWETAAMAERRGKPILVSHSCARTLCPHPRNLTDEMARRVASLGGVIGVNLVPEHLGGKDLKTVCRHLCHFATVVGEDRVCLGCDLDGTSALPEGIAGIEDLPKLYEILCENSYPNGFAEKVFYSNAQTFAKAHLF